MSAAIKAAGAAAEAVRALNHATVSGSGYEWPGDVDAVVGELTTLVQRLPQAIGQAGRWLDQQERAGRVGHDTPGADAAVTIGQARACLDDAAALAGSVAVALAEARTYTSHLTGITS